MPNKRFVTKLLELIRDELNTKLSYSAGVRISKFIISYIKVLKNTKA